MLVWNFIYANRHRGRYHTWASVIRELEGNQLYMASVHKKWRQLGENIVFQYDGTGKKTATTMGTVVFIRK